MEGLFDIILVVVVVIIGSIARSNKNKQKKGTQTARPAEPLTSISDRRMINRRNIENAVQAFSELAESMDKAAIEEHPAAQNLEQTSIEAETLADSNAVQEASPMFGQSFTDEHGCIGGSMPEHTAEGETVQEHAEHERRRVERLQAESDSVAANRPRKPSPTELRKAIVMSEILARPVGLRRKGL